MPISVEGVEARAAHGNLPQATELRSWVKGAEANLESLPRPSRLLSTYKPRCGNELAGLHPVGVGYVKVVTISVNQLLPVRRPRPAVAPGVRQPTCRAPQDRQGPELSLAKKHEVRDEKV